MPSCAPRKVPCVGDVVGSANIAKSIGTRILLRMCRSARSPVDSLFRHFIVEVFVIGIRISGGMGDDAVPMIRRRTELIELR